MITKYLKKPFMLLGLLFGFLLAPSVFAVVDYSTLTSAIDFGTVSTAILTAFAAIAGFYMVWTGGKLIIKSIKGA